MGYLKEEGFDKDTIATADMYSQMGKAFERQGQYPEADMYYTKEMNLRQALKVPSSDVSYSVLNNNIGMLRCSQGRYAEAVEILKKAIDANKKIAANKRVLAQSYN